jgi:hypothetical protein
VDGAAGAGCVARVPARRPRLRGRAHRAGRAAGARGLRRGFLRRGEGPLRRGGDRHGGVATDRGARGARLDGGSARPGPARTDAHALRGFGGAAAVGAGAAVAADARRAGVRGDVERRAWHHRAPHGARRRGPTVARADELAAGGARLPGRRRLAPGGAAAAQRRRTRVRWRRGQHRARRGRRLPLEGRRGARAHAARGSVRRDAAGLWPLGVPRRDRAPARPAR